MTRSQQVAIFTKSEMKLVPIDEKLSLPSLTGIGTAVCVIGNLKNARIGLHSDHRPIG